MTEAKEFAGWAELLDEFRALGGTAENIRLGEGSLGRGLFPIEPALPVHLHAPKNLLLPTDEVEFKSGKFGVSAASAMGSREKAWLERYENAFSWGGGGERDAESFLVQMHALPEPIREKLDHVFGMRFVNEAPTDALIQSRFLNSRLINHESRKVVMPLIELVNHGNAPGYIGPGVGVKGTFAGEVLVTYAYGDSLFYLQNWGFAAERSMAMSLPTVVPAEFGQLRIARALEEGEELEIPGSQGISIRLPKLTVEDKAIIASSLLLGFKGFPRVPKGAFHRVFRQAGQTVRDELFDQVMFINRTVFLDMLGDLEDVEGQMAKTLRAVCRMQLATLCHCIGVRPL